MGGRDPADVKRAVTLADAFAALGITPNDLGSSTAASVEELERQNTIRLPAVLKKLACQRGILDAIHDCHSNNPNFLPVSEWQLRRDTPDYPLCGEYAIVIMEPHQGDHRWAVHFDQGEDDPQVYVGWDVEQGGKWVLTAG